MNIFKKLLPIASIGGIAAIVTPLITSCSSKPIILEHEGQAGSFTRHKTTPLGSGTKAYVLDGTEKYLNDMAKDKNILAEDLMQYYVNNVMVHASPDEKLLKTTVIVENIDAKAKKCSFDVKLEIEVSGSIRSIPYTYEMDVEYSVKNLGYMLVYTMTDGGYVWYFCPAADAFASIEPDTDKREELQIAYLKAHEDWTASFTVDMERDAIALKWDYKSTEYELKNAIENVFKDRLSFVPQYFENVTPTGEQ